MGQLPTPVVQAHKKKKSDSARALMMLAAGLVKSSVEALARSARSQARNPSTHDDQTNDRTVRTLIKNPEGSIKIPDHPKIIKNPKITQESRHFPQLHSKCKLRQMMAVRVHNHCLHNADTARGSPDGLGLDGSDQQIQKAQRGMEPAVK